MNKHSKDFENMCAKPISNHANKVVLGHSHELPLCQISGLLRDRLVIPPNIFPLCECINLECMCVSD